MKIFLSNQNYVIFEMIFLFSYNSYFIFEILIFRNNNYIIFKMTSVFIYNNCTLYFTCY